MGQIAVGSLWKYISFLFIGSIVFLDGDPVIIIKYSDEDWRLMIVVLTKASFIIWAIVNSVIKYEKWNIDKVFEKETNRKLKLENELLELKIKEYGTDKFYEGKVGDSDPCIEQ